jgi:hypothetical protein
VSSMLSHRLKGNWSLRRRQGFHSTPSKLLILHRRSALLSNFGIIFTHMLFPIGRESIKRVYILLISIRFWRFMPKGEKVLAQSKRTAPPPTSKILKLRKDFFQFGTLFFIEFQIGTTLSKLISKTLLNTKRRILLRWSFV